MTPTTRTPSSTAEHIRIAQEVYSQKDTITHYSEKELQTLEQFNYPSTHDNNEAYEQAVRDLYSPRIQARIRLFYQEQKDEVTRQQQIFRAFIDNPQESYINVLLTKEELEEFDKHDKNLKELLAMGGLLKPVVQTLLQQTNDNKSSDPRNSLKRANPKTTATKLLRFFDVICPNLKCWNKVPEDVFTPNVLEAMRQTGHNLLMQLKQRRIITLKETEEFDLLLREEHANLDPVSLFYEYRALLELFEGKKKTQIGVKKRLGNLAASRIRTFNRRCTRYNIPLKAKQEKRSIQIINTNTNAPVTPQEYDQAFMHPQLETPRYLTLLKKFAEGRVYKNRSIHSEDPSIPAFKPSDNMLNIATQILKELGIATRYKKDKNGNGYWTIDIPTLAEKQYGFMNQWKQTFLVLLNAPGQRMTKDELSFMVTRRICKKCAFELIQPLRRQSVWEDGIKTGFTKRRLYHEGKEYIVYGARIASVTYYGLMKKQKYNELGIPFAEKGNILNFKPLIDWLLTRPGGITFQEVLNSLYFFDIQETDNEQTNKTRRHLVNQMLRRAGFHIIKLPNANIKRTDTGAIIPSISLNILLYKPHPYNDTSEQEDSMPINPKDFPLAIEEKPGENILEHFERLLQLPWEEFLIRIAYNYVDLLNYMIQNEINSIEKLQDWTIGIKQNFHAPVISKYIERKQNAIWEIITRLNEHINPLDLNVEYGQHASTQSKPGAQRLAKAEPSVRFIETVETNTSSTFPDLDDTSQSILLVLRDILFDEQGIIKIDPRVIIELMKYNLNDLRIQMKNSSQDERKNPPNSPEIELSTEQRIIASIYGVPLDS